MRPAHVALALAVATGVSCAPRQNARTTAAPGEAAAAPGGGAAIAEARELTADQQVLHALHRLGFGPRPGDVARVRAMGVDRWIARQLDPATIRDDSAQRFLARFTTLGRSSDALMRDYPPPALLRRDLRRDSTASREDSVAYRRAQRAVQVMGQELAAAKVARAVLSERQLEEVMVDFWANHFNVFAGKGPYMRHYLVAYDRDAIRPHALGRFRDLLGAVAASPAMLWYLDNAQNVADSGRPVLLPPAIARRNAQQRDGRRTMTDAPRPPQGRRRGLNENYARELLELHTLGVDGGYTQQDIIEVARAFTGWTIEPPRRDGMPNMGRMGGAARPARVVALADGSVFVPMLHDAGEKRVLGQTLPAGRGVEDGMQVLDIVARHPGTARFIAAKLARRLVSDTPPAELVARAAATFTRTDGDIREVVRTIVTSPEFFSRAAYRAKVKSPFEVVVSAMRAIGAEPDATPRTAQLVARLGQPIYGHQAPNGWPETSAPWVNTGAILNRINFGMAMGTGRVPGAARARWPFPAALETAPREEQVDAVVAALLGGAVSPDTRAVLVSGTNPLLSRAAADSVATDSLTTDDEEDRMMGRDRPRRGARDPLARRAPGSARLDGFAQIVGLALGAPEFQRK